VGTGSCEQFAVRTGDDAAAQESAALFDAGVVGVGNVTWLSSARARSSTCGTSFEPVGQRGGNQEQFGTGRGSGPHRLREFDVVADHHGGLDAAQIDDGGGCFRWAERLALLRAKKVDLGVAQEFVPAGRPGPSR
jgi:hypothetical protein